jgi:hypothetical protein
LYPARTIEVTPWRIDPNTFTPYPKNPLLANFFINIGRADVLGFGVRNLYRYTKIYSGGEPELADGLELVVEPGQAGLRPEQVRQLFREVLDAYERVTKTDDGRRDDASESSF